MLLFDTALKICEIGHDDYGPFVMIAGCDDHVPHFYGAPIAPQIKQILLNLICKKIEIMIELHSKQNLNQTKTKHPMRMTIKYFWWSNNWAFTSHWIFEVRSFGSRDI